MDALRDIVWEILREKGIDHKYEPHLQDGMPKPKSSFLIPFFDSVTWGQMTQAITEAQEIQRGQILKESNP